MFGLLSWLWGRAGRVYELFGSLYSSVVSAARNAYNWSRRAASDAYAWARSYAFALFQQLSSSLTYWVVYLERLVDSLYQAARYFVVAKFTEAQSAIALAREWLLQQIDNARQIVSSLALALVYAAKAELYLVLNGALSFIHAGLDPLLLLYDKLLNLVKIFTVDNISKLLYLLQTAYDWFIMFLQNPLGTLWAYFEPYIWTLGEYWLGYALGAVDQVLPPWPSIGSPGGSLPSPGGLGPPPEAGKLARPLSGMYISGNTFNNPPGHMGTDFGLTRGQTVYAAHDGKVDIARDLGDGYANCVTIRGSHWWTRYAHLQGFYVHEGETVQARQPIAAGDSTGNSTGDHLHLEVKYNGSFVDPILCF